MIDREILRDRLHDETGCTAQYDGFPCGTCFCAIESDFKLNNDIGDYWQAVLDYRGDYDDYKWGIETDTSRFPELIEELYDKLTEGE